MNPRVLVIGGLEPTGRAGLLADVWAVREAGGSPCGVASALTAQGRRFRSEPVSPAVLRAQLESVLDTVKVQAVKLGMLPGPESLRVLRRVLPSGIPWVVDPVVRSSRGQSLSRLRAADYLALAAPHVVLTPNALEAGWLLGKAARKRACDAAPSLDEAEAMAQALAERGFGGVVVKGGHLGGKTRADVVVGSAGGRYGKGRVQRLTMKPLERDALHHRGTGCRHASTLATVLARGGSLEKAARAAQQCVRRYLQVRHRPEEEAPR